jgi:molybdate transport system substrate-binding protein
MRHDLLRLAALAVALLAPPLARAQQARAVTVAVAANVKPAFDEIAAAWRARHPGVEVRATYGASGTIFAQIRNGAPFDLFLSADVELPAKLEAEGMSDGPHFVYASGALALWVPRSSPLDVARDGLRALLEPSVRRIAIANPRVAPYGRAAEEALRRAGMLEAVQQKLVFGQNVAQAAQFAQSGAAEAAILPLSLALGPPLRDEGRHWRLPASAHRPVEQAGVVLKAAREPRLARDLADAVLAARPILERWGYAPARR